MNPSRKYQSRFFIFFLPLVGLLITSCVDADKICCADGEDALKEKLVGKWTLVKQKAGIGSPGVWVDVEDGGILEFNADHSFFDSSNPNCFTGLFEVNRDTLTLDSDCPEYDVVRKYRIVEFKQSSLIITPITVICTEGCRFRYEKIQ